MISSDCFKWELLVNHILMMDNLGAGKTWQLWFIHFQDMIEEFMFSPKEAERIPCYSFIVKCSALELSNMIGASSGEWRRKTNWSPIMMPQNLKWFTQSWRTSREYIWMYFNAGPCWVLDLHIFLGKRCLEDHLRLTLLCGEKKRGRRGTLRYEWVTAIIWYFYFL